MSFALLLRDDQDTPVLDIFGAIGFSFWDVAISAREVAWRLKSVKADRIRVNINSDGGDPFDAFAIYHMLVEHPARVEVHINGIAASAASLVAMAGDEIHMTHGSWMMIHWAWGAVSGEPDELRSWADVLDKISGDAASLYAQRTGLSVERVTQMMRDETWMTAAEAKAQGFATHVTATKSKEASNSLGRLPSAAALSARGFMKIPQQLQRAQQLKMPFEPPEETTMGLPKSITAALSIDEGSNETTVLAALTAALQGKRTALELVAKLEAATGKLGEEAIGAALAWKTGHDRLAAVEAELKVTREAAEKTELEALLSAARDGTGYEDKKPRLTKAEADHLQAQVTSGTMSLAGVRGFLSVKAPVPHLSASNPERSTPTIQSPAASLHFDGKSYAQLSNLQRKKLQDEDPDLFAEMRRDWEKQGSPPAAA